MPGDPSSAAFAIAAGVLVPGSRLVLRGVGVNWTRTRLRAHRAAHGRRSSSATSRTSPATRWPRPSRSSDLDVTAGPLVGTVVEADEVPLAIDELPLVALLGCFAEGETVVRGAQELRLKESDRIATVVDGLAGWAASIEATEDGFVVRRQDRRPARRQRSGLATATTAWRCSARSSGWPRARASRSTGTGGLRGGRISSSGDHRLAMLGAVAGLASREGVEVDGMEAAEVSYPRFMDDMARLM